MPSRFYDRLKKSVNDFHFEEALKLSDEIHEAEVQGYKVSEAEDMLWAELTDKIEENRAR